MTYALAPTLIFIPTYFMMSQENRRDLYFSKHIFYAFAWFMLCISHLILFLPFSGYWAWLSLTGSDTIENGHEFYELWLKRYIVPGIRPVTYFNVVMFSFVLLGESQLVFTNFTGEDANFKYLHPFLILLFYVLSMPMLIGLIEYQREDMDGPIY